MHLNVEMHNYNHPTKPQLACMKIVDFVHLTLQA